MKKIVSVILCISMTIFLTSCGSKKTASAREVTKAFLDAYQRGDSEAIQQYSQWDDYNVKALEIQESDYMDGVDKKLQKQVYTMMKDFQHKEGEESIHENAARVKVTLTIYDFEPVIQSGIEEAKQKAQELIEQSDVSEEQAQGTINTILFQNMKEAKQDKEKVILINLLKQDGKWLVSKENADIQNLLLENLSSLQK